MWKSWRKPSAASTVSAMGKSSIITAGALRYLTTFGKKPGPKRIERRLDATETTTQIAPPDVAGDRNGPLGRGRHAGANTGKLDAQKAVGRRSDSFGPPAVSRRHWRLVSGQAAKARGRKAADRRCAASDEGFVGKGGLVAAERAQGPGSPGRPGEELGGYGRSLQHVFHAE